MPRVLVTGASGRLGRAVLRRAQTLPVEIVTLSTRGGRVELTDAAALRAAVTDVRPDAIVHLAAVTGAACEADPHRATAVNETATRDLVAIAERMGVEQFVLASSAAVYGEQGAVHLGEDASLDGSSVYARSKIAAERIVADSGIPDVVSLRIFNVWGPGFDSSLVERLRRSEAEDPITLTGWTEFVRDYVHADDVAEAIALALTSSASFRGPVNVGTGEGTSTAELVRRLELSHRVSFRVVDGEPTHSVASIARATALWGFAPARRVPDGVSPDRSA